MKFRCEPIIILVLGVGMGIAAWFNGLGSGRRRCRAEHVTCPTSNCSERGHDLRWGRPGRAR